MSIFFKNDKEAKEIIGNDNGTLRNIKEVYANKNGKPCLVWRKNRGPTKRFVAVGKIGDTIRAVYSFNGADWFSMTGLPTKMPDNTIVGGFKEVSYYRVVYGNGVFVTCNSQHGVYYSADGETWHEAIAPTKDFGGGTNTIPYGYPDIIFANGMFVTLRGNIGAINSPIGHYSYDGINWNPLEGNYSSFFVDSTGSGLFISKTLTYGDGKFVAIGKKSCYSEDGIHWEMGDLEKAYYTCALGAYLDAASGFLKRGFYKFMGNSKRQYSADGIHWVDDNPDGSNPVSSSVSTHPTLFLSKMNDGRYCSGCSDGLIVCNNGKFSEVRLISGFNSRTDVFGYAYGNGVHVLVGDKCVVGSYSDSVWEGCNVFYGPTLDTSITRIPYVLGIEDSYLRAVVFGGV